MAPESAGMGRNPQEWHWNELKWTFGAKVTIMTSFQWTGQAISTDIVLIYRTTFFSLLSLLLLHIFKSVSQAVYRYCPNLHKDTLLYSFPDIFTSQSIIVYSRTLQ